VSVPDVSGAGTGKDAVDIAREGDVRDVLRERLAAQHDELLSPVPDGQHVVRIAGDGRQHPAVGAAVINQTTDQPTFNRSKVI